MKGKIIVEHLDNEQVEFDTLQEAQESILESYTDKDEGIHPDIEAVKIYKEICKIEVPENEDGTYQVNFVPLDGQVSGKFAEETFELVINNLLENRPLYKDSGLWQIRTEDMTDVLYQQNVNETFIEFINRVFKNENQLQEL